MKHVLAAFVLLACGAFSAQAGIVTEEITYTSGDTAMRGYLAQPEGSHADLPGILVVHEWWGHNDYARKRARMLAEEGYVAFAIDMYGDGKVAGHPGDAKSFSSEVAENLDAAQARFKAGLDVIKKQAATNPDKIAGLGYCFGGGVLLNMARAGIDLDAVISVHGSLSPGIDRGDTITPRILVCHGADDPFIPEADISAFKVEMADADMTFIEYPGAVHSFSNPDADRVSEEFGLPIAYNREADEQSWKDMLEFLEETFSR